MKAMTHYNILRVKQKLSYSAFLRSKTIKELWLGQILQTLNMLMRTKQFEETDNMLSC